MSLERLPDESYETWIDRIVASKQNTTPQFADDLVPATGYAGTPESFAVDQALASCDILDAYTRWCHKSDPKANNKRESIMVSCPNPDHPDRHPSAWITLEKGEGGLGNCALCGGFDKYDIFAWYNGYSVPSYKSKFNELKKHMAVELGFSITKSAGQITVVAEPEESVATVTTIYPSNKDLVEMAQGDDFVPPSFDWRQLPGIEPDTFLHTWLTITSESTEPEEFYFWLGLQALGLAVGNNVLLADSRPYRPNLMLCLVGNPGSGKTAAMGKLQYLLHQAIPFKPEFGNAGVFSTSSIASGEALIASLNQIVENPTNPGVKVQMPIKSLVTDAELASLMARSGRNGNTLKETIQSFYDSNLPVHTFSVTGGRREVTDHFVSFVTSTQHNRIEDLLKNQDANSGFISRWLFAYGKPKQKQARNAKLIDVDECVEPLRKIRAWGALKRLVDFHDPVAAQQFDKFFYETLDKLASTTINPTLVRLDLMCRKLLLLLAINDKSTTITVNHVETLKLLWPYLLNSYGSVSAAITTDPLNTLMNKIENFVDKFHDQNSAWPTRRDIARGFTARRKDFDYALEALVRDGRLIEVNIKSAQGSGGRPTTRYRLPSSNDPMPVLMTT